MLIPLSIVDPLCPPPFVQMSSSFNQSKNCSPSGCCVPCPVHDYFYPTGSFATAVNIHLILNVVSAILTSYVAISWMLLPGRRTHPGDIVLHFCIAILLWQVSTLFAIGKPSRIQCADLVTPSTASNNLLCGAQGGILMISVHATIMWAAYMIFNLHATIVWRSSVFERFKPLGVFVCWGLPGVFTCIAFLVSQIDSSTGVVCIISSDSANQLFFSFQSIVAIPAFFVNLATMVHIVVAARRATSSTAVVKPGIDDKEASSDPKPMSIRRQVLLLFKLNWRALLLGFYYIFTYAIYSWVLPKFDIISIYSHLLVLSLFSNIFQRGSQSPF